MDTFPTTPAWLQRPRDLVTYVGGVGQLFQSDHDVGRLVVERLLEAPESLPAGTMVEDLSYGAISASHRLQELAPVAAVLVGSRQEDGRPPGSVHRRVVREVDRSTEELQGAVQDAGTGYVDLELTVEVCAAFGTLPGRTVVIEVEPARTSAGEGLSDEVAASMDEVLRLVRRECKLTPLFDAAEQLDQRLAALDPEPTATSRALRDVVASIAQLDRTGRWGHTFAHVDRLQLAISSGDTGGDLEHVDWGLLWGIVEEGKRLEAAAVTDDDL